MALTLPVTFRAYRVWQRDRDTFLRLWKTESWPAFVEGVLTLGAIGFGIGIYIKQINGLSYPVFVAPGVLAVSAMFSSSFECLFGSFIRMEFQRTFDAIIATPVSIEDVITGEIMWGATRSFISTASILVVVILLGLMPSALGLLMLPLSLLSGFMFASIAMIFTSRAPAIDAFNYYITLALTPMFLFSGTYFPISQLAPPLQALAWFSPLTHVINLSRALMTGEPSAALWLDVAWLAVVGSVAYLIALRMMRSRLIK
jgi:lipooligosaccharide transport system permease protein